MNLEFHEQMMGHYHNTHIDKLLDHSLLSPVNTFLSNPGKNIRPKLVELGFLISADQKTRELLAEKKKDLELASTIVECIHGGALIVDDIQDGSLVRRNRPTFHIQHGIPLALNAGNWLYFRALELVRLLDVEEKCRSALLEDCLRLMSHAHLGQAIDIGTKIDLVPKDHVLGTCLTSMQLKTGTLLSLALRLGGAIGSPCETKHKKLIAIGLKLGVILQLFDDIGNFTQQKSLGETKRHEDLRLRRPTWIWARASTLEGAAYEEFLSSLSTLPDETKLDEWISKHEFHQKLRDSSALFLGEFLQETQELVEDPEDFLTIKEICNQLEKAYVS